jgi:SAM-dependent methyltransferase
MINILFTLFLISIFLLLKLVYLRTLTTRYGAPFVPMEPEIVTRILDQVRIKKGDIFFDLGSGDGRLVIAAALKGAEAYGIEIDPIRVWYSRLWIYILRLSKRAKILKKNIFDVDLSKADIITAYLLPETHKLLQSKLEKEAKNGTRIVGIAFKFPGWKPSAIDPNGTIFGPIYYYRHNG